jgi:hypothetical protein
MGWNMQVQIAIGENHRFELREALLVYYGNQTTFITKHEVTTQQNAAPTLGPAQPLTVAFVESLVRSLGGGADAEVLPENILAKSDRMIAWWTPAQRRQMFYQNSEGKAADLNGRNFPQPPLVWRIADGQLKIRALTENQRRRQRPSSLSRHTGISQIAATSARDRCGGLRTHPLRPYLVGSGASTRVPLPTPMLVALPATRVASRGFGAAR